MTKHATPPATYMELCEILAENVPTANIKQRDGGGNTKLSYVQDKYQRTHGRPTAPAQRNQQQQHQK